MPTLLIMCGLSFSGKTTLARRIGEATGSAVVSYDELYATVERDPSVTGLDEWYLVVGLVHEHARAHLAAGRSVVVDSLNEEVVDRDRLRAVAAAEGAEALVVHVEASLETIAERRRRNDATRERGTTSDENFRFVLSRFEAPGPWERHVRFGPEDDVEEWVRELRERVFAGPADG